MLVALDTRCRTLVLGRACGHAFSAHILFGPILLDCWQCEDLHVFAPAEVAA